jgi:hypothetical protein
MSCRNGIDTCARDSLNQTAVEHVWYRPGVVETFNASPTGQPTNALHARAALEDDT